jgi:hypothetical protein
MEMILTLTAAEPMSEKELEQHMFEVLEVVERDGPDRVLGPVVAANFDAGQIELLFTARADTISGAQALVAEVIATVERHTDINFTGAGTSAREPDRELELVG